MNVLVTGATGYVGSRLVPRLLQDGHQVRTTTFGDEDPVWWHDQVETVEMDISDDDEVDAAVQGMDAVYYLVHGLDAKDFVRKDREAAERVASAVNRYDVARVVYLSGIVPDTPEDELSDHIRSRHEVEQVLTSTSATVIALRAAVLLGAGSTSFEIVRQVSERLPLVSIPTWMDHQVQPIAAVDAIEALAGALTVDSPSRHYDVGGPQRLRYSELVATYTRAAGLTRPQVTVPKVPEQLVAALTGRLVDVPLPTVEALVESLQEDMVCADEDFVTALLPEGHRLLGVEESVRRALQSPITKDAEAAAADPMRILPQDPPWAGSTGGPVTSLFTKARRLLPGT